MKPYISVCLFNLILTLNLAKAFQVASPLSRSMNVISNTNANSFSTDPRRHANNRPLTHLYSTVTSQVEDGLKENYPLFHRLIMSQSSTVWKELSEASSDGFTLFILSDDAMRNLGDKKLSQLEDVRNGETAEKMAAYHAVNEPVGAEELFNSGGVVTIGGVVDIGRSTTGGFMGIGGKEDGGITVNGARILQSFNVDNAVVHEVDKLISPEILWRYCDQLRIPGSK